VSNLSDSQVEILLSAARPLPPTSHAAFLEEATEALASCPELGDGVVYRVARETQRRYWDPPNFTVDRAPRLAR